MMGGTALMAWSVALPLIGAVLSLLVGRAGVRLVAGVASVATLIASSLVAWEVSTQGVLRQQLGGWGAPLGIEWRADGLAALMLLTIAVVGPLISVHALDHLGDREDREFLPLWLFIWCALNALVLSADAFNLYVTLELTTLGAVSLIVVRRDLPGLDAGLRYLLFALPGSLCYLLGIAFLYGAYATLDVGMLAQRVQSGPVTWVAAGLVTVGLCLKTPLFPLHVWLPPTYTGAPTPVTALLSALISKGSFYVLLRLWLEVFAPVLDAEVGQLLGLLGAVAVLWGSVLALSQTQLKRVVAYSSVAQIGYMFLVFPMATSGARAGVIYLVVSHAAAKASMFVAVGNIHQAVGITELGGVQGLAYRMPFTFLAMALGGISLIGIPPSGGFIAKWLLLNESIGTQQWWWALVLLGGSLLAAAYVFRILRGSFLPLPPGVTVRSIPLGNELAPLALALIALLLGLVPWFPLDLLAVGASR
ncbi:oxidoreductase [Myxococcus llanfairpwllgwyngyllgogerychwyrndrobwllllantysiliogogogochensis]|uniref:Oxidoreductase n=1 Tax=Myxococcus llanfairpwllgwyngyllgogerychwyrndrobwllllantysiliogogogochensis TaxID=2590453 RepID=A0A540X3I0_9BACT|nr:proton-conducting transporter membrane subunit [Myxococcus llanfairpwllgwyngyllgogerychwyrndrobwllllantysiliogogogochensis]TQF15805.1 oxidoreductase [Myxococcus llanfairpwllgwyngyllgogerychwyrndrobwllllantysiliogogogochensis]